MIYASILLLVALVATSSSHPSDKFVWPLTQGTPIENQICGKNGKTTCKGEETCCKIGSTGDEYGCCPLNNAVCCSNGQSCCPTGYSCTKTDGRCVKNNVVESLSTIATTSSSSCSCSSSQTCCTLSDGQQGCCPVQNAVCCSDGEHCCPESYTCDAADGKCTKGDLTTPLLKKQPASEKLESVTCPDGSACPSGNTCCSVGGDRYGCCPQENAVCCSDDKHCCPSGYTCETSDGKCAKGDLTIPFLKKQPSIPRVESVTCPDGSACPSGNTCCSVGGDRYGCCPQENAVCCSDDKHCCPSGYTCDVSECSKGDITIPFLKKQPSIPRVESVTCPDGSACPSGNTCCSVGGDRYGCCPQENAVCCSDDKHCCPSGYTCDVSECSKGDITIPFLKKQPSIPHVESVTCPDGSACPSGNTCCSVGGDRYGCCPQENAVCCSDDKHCCPSGYTCDVSECSKGDITIPFLKKQPSIPHVESVTCPDGSACPSGNTCCTVGGDRYGCCPQENAVCCSDDKHCCPSGYTCETADGKCAKGDLTIPFLKKQPSIPRVKSEKLESVTCPDGSACPSGNTCCSVGGDRYGCCPQENAVCCSDDKHCCPSGYTCETADGKCAKGDLTIPFLKKQPSIPRVKSEKLESVKCPDGQSSCPSGNTCCKTSSGQYACCPVKDAVCCGDEVHCCPEGYTCDVADGKCMKSSPSMNSMIDIIVEYRPTNKLNQPESVVCPDGNSECPTGTTCCKISSSEYGCCPQPKAVCCSDNKHCCPQGYTCDTSDGTCSRGDITTPLLKKQPAMPVKSEIVRSVICPDGSSECPSGNTCCKVSSREYGCCPELLAVCCSDNKHCCPFGYTCDTNDDECSRGDITTPLLKKQPAMPVKSEIVRSVICPDGGSQCPTGNTCCQLSTGRWGCCPVANAVCCSDGVHCCPEGKTCNLDKNTCDDVPERVEQVPVVLPAIVEDDKDTSICPNKKVECAYQCCKGASSSSYMCCPISPRGGVCCTGANFCCKSGQKCVVSGTKATCEDTDGDQVAATWLEHVDLNGQL